MKFLQKFNKKLPCFVYSYLYKNCEIRLRNVMLMPLCSKTEKSKYLQIRNLSSRNNYDAGEFDLIEDIHEKELDSKKFCLKEMLYKSSNDELIKSLNECSCPTEVLKHFQRFQDLYDAQHVTQTVVLLWNYARHNISELDVIKSQEQFEIFLKKLNDHVNKMNADEITCCLLYLSKIGVDTNHATMKNLLETALQQISNRSSIIPISALSRLSVAVKTNEAYQNSLIFKNIIPHIPGHIKTCTSDEEIRLITICMQNLHLFTMDILDLYKCKVKSLIATNIINGDYMKPIVKIINFLSAPNWSQDNATLIRDLLLLLSNKVSDMSAKTLTIIFKVFENQLEPASFIPKLAKAADELFEKYPTPELLACVVQFTQPKQKEKMTEIVKAMIVKEIDSNSLPAYFKILRSLKISDIDLCDLYWSKVLNEIKNINEERDNYRLYKYCHRYMFFNNNLGGTYRHLEFEKYASGLLMETIVKDILAITPSKFVRLASFIIAYGHTNEINSKLPDTIVDKIEEMTSQFSITDCLQLSRGLQIALELRYRHFLPQNITRQFLRIENILNMCAENHLQSEHLNLHDLNYIIRSFNNRKSSRKTAIYKNAIEKYKLCKIDLNSRIIRDITFNLSSANYLVTEIYGDIFKYIVKNRDYVIGDTIEKIIHSAYQLGYIPESDDALHWSAEIIKRDFQYMNSLSIVQACVALCFYKALPEALIHKVFSIEFIRRIEEEIQTCYSKATYPDKILNQVMQLNRAVCLDFPEAQVPWFQQNYIEAQISRTPALKSKFYMDIKNLLVSIVQSEYLTCNYITPYGYTIDFVILFDKFNKPILATKENMMIDRITKVGILLLKQDSYSENKTSNMKGKENLKMRHLEMLGYNVININLKDWNSMYMNVPGLKLNYLKYLLHIQ